MVTARKPPRITIAILIIKFGPDRLVEPISETGKEIRDHESCDHGNDIAAFVRQPK
jgi:hypothetical protein